MMEHTKNPSKPGIVFSFRFNVYTIISYVFFKKLFYPPVLNENAREIWLENSAVLDVLYCIISREASKNVQQYLVAQ